MKANELRICNLFKFGVFIRVAKASDIADLEFIDKLDKKHSPYKPIPITKDWLVKFGFEKYKGVFRIKLNRDDYFLRCNFYGDNLGLVVDEFDFLGSVESVSLNPIQYVHQLQNLYFVLAGKELTIKDFDN